MKFTNKDRKELLPESRDLKEHSLLCYLPLFTGSVLLGFTTASILICSLLDGFVKLSALTNAKGSMWTSGILISSLPGFFTVWSFHYLAWGRIKEVQFKYWIFFSCLSGILSQASLLLLGLSPLESTWMSNSVDLIQKQVLLSTFMISSIIFACFSLNLTLLMSSQEPRGLHPWVFLKVLTVGLMMTVALGQGVLSLYSQIYEDMDLELINDIVQYVCFYLQLFYFSSFYLDLSDMKFSVNFGDKDLHDAYSSTF
jgi:hypothetical protein